MTPFETAFTLSPVHVDRFGNAKPSALLLFCQEAAAGHCAQLGLDWDTLMEKNLFWALIRTRMEITRLPRTGETLTVKTWPMPTTRVAYPRATAGYDEKGQELFRSTSLWVLMDAKSRGMLLPGKSGITLEGITLGEEAPVPPSLTPKEMTEFFARQVRFTDIDRNGHMNNTRYMEWFYDALDSETLGNRPIKAFTACYLSEAREKELLHLGWTRCEDGCIRLEIRRDGEENFSKLERVFAVSAEF